MGVFQSLQGVTFPNTLPLLTKDPIVTVGTLSVIDTLRTLSWDGTTPVEGSSFSDLSIDGIGDLSFRGTGGVSFGGAGGGIVHDGTTTGNKGRYDYPTNTAITDLHNRSFVLLVWLKHQTPVGASEAYFGRALANTSNNGQFLCSKPTGSNNALFYVWNAAGSSQLIRTQSLTVGTIYQLGITGTMVGSDMEVSTIVNGSVSSTVTLTGGLANYATYKPTIFAYGNLNFYTPTKGTFYRSVLEDLDVSGRTASDVALADYQANISRFS